MPRVFGLLLLVVGVGCAASPPRAAPARPPGSALGTRQADTPAAPPVAASREVVIDELGLRLVLPPGAVLDEVRMDEGPITPNFFVRFPVGGLVLFVVHRDSDDPIAKKRAMVAGPERLHLQHPRVLLDAPDAIVVEADSPLLGHHCQVSACSRTTPRYCTDASGVVLSGEIETLTIEECHAVVDLTRSLTDRDVRRRRRS